jgi:hypothetical protein
MAAKKATTAPKKAPTAGATPAKRPAPKTTAKKPEAPKRPTGRPSLHTPETVRALCEHLMAGMDLRTACAQPGMPSVGTVCRWLHDDVDGFREQYARAREIQAELEADEVRSIADAPAKVVPIEWTNHKQVSRRVPVLVAIDAAEIAQRRLQVDARKWRASKMAPKRYGDRLDVTQTTELTVDVRDHTGRKFEPGQKSEADE